MRDGARRLGPVLWVVAALGVGAAFVVRPGASHMPTAPAHPPSASGAAAAASAAGPSTPASQAIAEALGAKAGSRSHWPAPAGVQMPAGSRSATRSVQVARTVSEQTQAVKPLRHLRQADLLVVGQGTLPASLVDKVRRLHGVEDAQRIDAATIGVNGQFIQMLGVDPGKFRAFAARPTAKSTALWRSVASGDIAVSYFMGKQDKIRLGGTVHVAGKRSETLRVGGYGTVGISGVDAVVSHSVAATLGLPSDNALVISAPHTRLASLMKKVKRMLPHRAAVAQLVSQSEPGTVIPARTASSGGTTTSSGAAGSSNPVSRDGAPITAAQVHAFLKAALSRVGMPYVWGAKGPHAFDCSGLVWWSMRQAGITMPRVAIDQAKTGPQVPLSVLRPGDLLFYHTDPTAPAYISHVAIYLGNGLMVQAPEPGMNVQIVRALFGSGFAGAVRVYPSLAAAVAGNPAG